MKTLMLSTRPWLRLSVLLALLSGFALVPTVRATDQSKLAANPDAPQGNCPVGETETLVFPTLQSVTPSNPHAGDAVEVKGSGGYIQCSGGLYNESARSFELTLDGQTIGQLGCYANHCQTSSTIPANTSPGAHTIATEGDSALTIQVQSGRMVMPVLFLPAVIRGTTQQESNESPISGCPANETATLIAPSLELLLPASAEPGGSVRVTGSGGYVRCSGGLYNESARSFDLMLDGAVVAQLGCYANHCEATLIVPTNTQPGTYQVSTIGGSQLPLIVQ